MVAALGRPGFERTWAFFFFNIKGGERQVLNCPIVFISMCVFFTHQSTVINPRNMV